MEKLKIRTLIVCEQGCPFFFSASLVFRSDLSNISLIPFAKFLIFSCHAGWK
jgi:hypothetical protein